MSESWDNIAVGMKVEVINTDCQLQNEAYWIATVVQLAGMVTNYFIHDYCVALIIWLFSPHFYCMIDS